MLHLLTIIAAGCVSGYMTERSPAFEKAVAIAGGTLEDPHPDSGFDADGGPMVLRRRLACRACHPFELHKRVCWCECDNKGAYGDSCSVGCPCKGSYRGQKLYCSAGSFRCETKAMLGETCHATEKCKDGLSCQPGVQKCYHKPRHFKEPCSVGYGCKNGFSCQPGVQKCYHKPRWFEEPCSAGFSCGRDDGDNMNCHPGIHKCYHVPRRFGEPCSLGFSCGSGLSCEDGVGKDGGSHKCWHQPRWEGEPCRAGQCKGSMKCERLSQIEDGKVDAKVSRGSVCYYQ